MHCYNQLGWSFCAGMEFSYHAFITLGTVEQIRKVFSGIRGWALKNNPKLLESPVPSATLAI